MKIEVSVIEACPVGTFEVEIADANTEHLTARGLSKLIDKAAEGGILARTSFTIRRADKPESIAKESAR